MVLVWRCECGEDIPETGDRKGHGIAVHHRSAHKKKKEDFKILGLFDATKNEMLIEGIGPHALALAQAQGYIVKREKPIPTKEEKLKELKEKEVLKTGNTVGSMRPHIVQIPWAIDLYYNYACMACPGDYDYQGDGKSPNIGFGEYLLDCCKHVHENVIISLLNKAKLDDLTARMIEKGVYDDFRDLIEKYNVVPEKEAS